MTKLYHGYLVLVSTFFLNFVAIGAFNSAGLYLGPLAATFPSSGESTLALYCTFQIVAGLLSSFGGGIAQDALDKRGVGVQWLFFGGGAFMALGFVWSSMSSSLLGVLLGSLLMGVGLGLGGFMAGGICVLWFEAARGTMLLLAMSGQGLGNVFFAWVTARLLEHYHGLVEDPWRPTMRCMALLCFVLCAVAAASMRLPDPGEVEEHEKGQTSAELKKNEEGTLLTCTNYGAVDSHRTVGSHWTVDSHRTHKSGGTGPEKRHLRRRSSLSVRALDLTRIETGHIRQPAGHHCERRRSTTLGSFNAIGHAPLLRLSDFSEERHGSLRSFFGETINETINEESDYTLRELAVSSTNVWLNAFTLAVCFPFLNMQVLLPPYISSLGMPPSIGGYALAMFGVGDFLSNLTLGTVADRIGACRLFAFAFFNLSLLFFVWPYCGTVASLSTVAFFYGYFCCTISSMPIIILADAYGESSSEHILALNGITNMFKFPGYLLGPSIAGLLVQRSGGYGLAAVCSGVTTLIGTLMLLFVPSPEEQQRQLLEHSKDRTQSEEQGAENL